MEDIWRFYNGTVSGFVIAKDCVEALDRANEYINLHFSNGKDTEERENEMQVWSSIRDDDYENDCPFVLAVAY